MLDNLVLAIEGAWKVLAIGLVLGAGLPMVFALGVRSLAYGVGGDAEDGNAPGNPIGKLGAVLCFGLVAVAIVLGITAIVASGFGKELAFNGGFPSLVDES